MGKGDIAKRPKRVAGDAAYRLVKAGISAIPGVGGPAAEIFSTIIVPPLTKRRDEWIEAIAEGLQQLEAKYEGIKIEDLSQNEVFVTTLMQASQAAIRNHQKEKLDALRNAVLNAALPNAPEEDMQLMLLGFVDTCTTWHLRILKLFDDPLIWAAPIDEGVDIGSSAESPSMLLEAVYGELAGRRDFYDPIVKELFTRGLISIDSLHEKTDRFGLMSRRTTELGRRFLEFINPPLEANLKGDTGQY